MDEYLSANNTEPRMHCPANYNNGVRARLRRVGWASIAVLAIIARAEESLPRPRRRKQQTTTDDNNERWYTLAQRTASTYWTAELLGWWKVYDSQGGGNKMKGRYLHSTPPKWEEERAAQLQTNSRRRSWQTLWCWLKSCSHVCMWRGPETGDPHKATR